MKGAWWVGKDDLDDNQKAIITLPEDRSFAILGPPGSGKTNLLLLRANYLYLSGYRNLLIVVFTRSLRDFIALGAGGYDFPMDNVLTSRKWATRFLVEHGVKPPRHEDFNQQRQALLSAIQTLIEERKIENLYDAILLDEAQDYTLEEIAVFRRLTPRLCLAADKKQKLYPGNYAVEEMKSFVDVVKELDLHYRNGMKICRLADAIGARWPDYNPMLNSCNYDEDSMPSSVDVMSCKNIEQQAEEIIKRLDLQLKAYPDELIGVVAPKNIELEVLWRQISASSFAGVATLYGIGQHTGFNAETRICVTTAHGAKGLEFRTMHFAGCEFLQNFPNQYELTFTAVTRCKTSITIYYSDTLPGYLDAALAKLQPLPELPALSDVFGRKN